MDHQTSSTEPGDIWTPLYRVELEELLRKQEYTAIHIRLLYWLIWHSLLSGEELIRVLSLEETSRSLVQSKHDLSEQIAAMKKLRVIDAVRLRELFMNSERYYVTDLGLYLYLSMIQPTPPLSPARLAKSYPVTRNDLLSRLAHPHTHTVLSDFVTRLIEEGNINGYHLASYQQPWRHRDQFGGNPIRFQSDAALLLAQDSSIYAFLVYVDIGPHQKADKLLRKLLERLLDARTSRLLYRQQWPGLLIISTPDRLPLWAQLLQERYLLRMTRPLSGGITTEHTFSSGVSAPIWWDLEALASGKHQSTLPFLQLSDLFQHPASDELVEMISRHHQFSELRLKDAAAPPPRTRPELTRYVGNALAYEAHHLTKDHLQALFGKKRSGRSIEEAGVLTLALTAFEKAILMETAQHPLLDIATLQAMLRPTSDPQAIKPLQQAITHLFQLHLIETRLWPGGDTSGEQQRYLLTSVALRFMAIRSHKLFSAYFVPPNYQKGDDEQLDRQKGVRGLAHQMPHTHGLYSLMGQLIRGAHKREEVIFTWKNAYESILTYINIFSQEHEKAVPDATVVFAASPHDESITILLEYDRGTMGEEGYLRKFKPYLDYQLSTKMPLPLILFVTTSAKAKQRVKQVLDNMGVSFSVVILLERDLLALGLTRALQNALDL